MTFERFEGRYTVEGRLRALADLHVGAANSALAVATDRPVARDALGQPLIPGGTLKGALRIEVERIVRAVRPARACSPAGGEAGWCISVGRQATSAGAGNRPTATTTLPAETCWVCRLFGAPWLASHVQVADLPVDLTTWLGTFQVREGAAVDRDTDTGRRGLGYDYEVVPAGTEFTCQLRVDTDDSRLLGMLALGLRALETGELALGGGRTWGLGRVELAVERRVLVRRDAESLLAYLVDPASGAAVEDATVREWIAAFLDCLRADLLPEETG